METGNRPAEFRALPRLAQEPYARDGGCKWQAPLVFVTPFGKEAEICKASMLIVRSKDNQIRAFHNVCPHRANQVETRSDQQIVALSKDMPFLHPDVLEQSVACMSHQSVNPKKEANWSMMPAHIPEL